MNEIQPSAAQGVSWEIPRSTAQPMDTIDDELPSPGQVRAASVGKLRRIGLFDHMGMGNLGDAAVHESFIQNIRKRLPDVELVSFSHNPADTEKRHKLQSFSIKWYVPALATQPTMCAPSRPPAKAKAWLRRYCWFAYGPAKRFVDFGRNLRHLKHSYDVVRSLDLLIMAGGGQLTDLWRGMPYSVWKFCLIARLSKTPVYILGVGADQLKQPMSKLFAKWAVEIADYCSFRDVESQNLIRSLGATAETHVWPDPAYAIACPRAERRDRSLNLMRKVGINPMGYCDPRLWPRKDAAAYNSYLEKMARFSAWLLAQNYTIELFTSDIGMDKYALDDLQERISRVVDPQLVERLESRPVTDLDGLLAQISSFDYVVTTKFHGVLFSHLLGKPVIALSYLPKIGYLMRSAGQQRYEMDIEKFDSDRLIERFIALARDAADLGPRLLQVAEMRREALKTEFDKLFPACGLTYAGKPARGSENS